MNGIFLYQLEHARDHFDENWEIKGDGKWRIGEIAQCLRKMHEAYKAAAAADNAASAERDASLPCHR